MKTTRKVALLLSIVMALSLIAGCAKTAKSARLKVDGKTVKMDSIMTLTERPCRSTSTAITIIS